MTGTGSSGRRQVTREEFLPAVRVLRESGARFLSLAVQTLEAGEADLTYFFALGEQVRTLGLCTEGGAVPSLFSFYGAADFPEREAARTFGVKFVGHPNLPRGGDER